MQSKSNEYLPVKAIGFVILKLSIDLLNCIIQREPNKANKMQIAESG